LSLINSGNGIIGIDYGEMSKARSHLKKARDASTELNRRINSAINKLQVNQGSSRIKMATDQLRAYSRQITRMQSEMDKEINKMDRAVRRFKEVDSACAARIRAIGEDESDKKESFFEEVEDKVKGVIGFGEEELESAKNKIKGEWEEYKEDDPIGAGKILGTYDFAKDIIIGPVRIVDEKVKEFSSDPVGTIKRWAPYIWKFKTGDFIGIAVSYVTSHAEIKNVPKVIMNNIVNEFDEKFVKGDMLTKSRYITNLRLNIASLFVGGGELKAASEIGDIDKLGEVSEVTNVGDEINNIDKIDAGGSNAEISQSKIDEILSMERGTRPDPFTYLSKEYIANHLAEFDGGVTKITANPPSGVVGPPGGTFVMPKSVADALITQSGGDVAKLEELLSLEPGTLGSNPVRVDIESPEGLRMPSGNEFGANSQWIPGGYTGGRITEATIDPAVPGTYTVTPIK
jgi:hypothetical protein